MNVNSKRNLDEKSRKKCRNPKRSKHKNNLSGFCFKDKMSFQKMIFIIDLNGIRDVFFMTVHGWG